MDQQASKAPQYVMATLDWPPAHHLAVHCSQKGQQSKIDRPDQGLHRNSGTRDSGSHFGLLPGLDEASCFHEENAILVTLYGRTLAMRLRQVGQTQIKPSASPAIIDSQKVGRFQMLQFERTLSSGNKMPTVLRIDSTTGETWILICKETLPNGFRFPTICRQLFITTNKDRELMRSPKRSTVAT